MARKRRDRWRRVKTRAEALEEKLERRRAALRRRERFGRGVADLFEIPEDIVLNVPRITIIGNLQMIIENHRGLIEYSPQRIRVGTGGGQLVIRGEELAVGSVFVEDLSVMGRFEVIEFEGPANGEEEEPR
ncbi:MAG: sporulation protein YqfC [Bacillota bacterium]